MGFAVIDLVSESADDVDLIHARVDRGETNPAHGEDSADDLTDTAKPGDDDRSVLLRNDVEGLGLGRIEQRIQHTLIE